MILNKQIYKIYLLIWLVVSTLYFVCNFIGIAFWGTLDSINLLIIYHLTVSILWIIIAFLMVLYLTSKGNGNLRYLTYLVLFFPVTLFADSLYRALLRNLIFDVPFEYESIFLILLTLLESNILIYCCLALLSYLIYKYLLLENGKLDKAIEEKSLTQKEFERVSSIVPPDFLARNLHRITDIFEASNIRGNLMIAYFSDFLRKIIYEFDTDTVTEAKTSGIIDVYNNYLSVYLEKEVILSTNSLDGLYDIDKQIKINDSGLEQS